MELIQDMIAPITHNSHNLSTEQQTLLYNYQIKRQAQSVSVLDKKRLCLEAGLTLNQVNEWLQSQAKGVGLVSVNQTSFADGINGILEANNAGVQHSQQMQPDMNYLSQIFGGFGSQDLQFEPFDFFPKNLNHE
jgi:hypothetical protein